MTETNSPAIPRRRPSSAPGGLTAVGVGLLIWGLIVGFAPSDGCGSPFWPDDPSGFLSDTSSAATCAQTFGADGTFAAALLILAGLCFLAAVVVHEVERMFFPALVPSQPAVELTLDGPQTVE